MDKLDRQIREALKSEDAAVLSQFESDSSLPAMVAGLYRGRRRWVNLSATVVTFGIFVAQIGCGFRFFEAESTQAMIGWATGFLAFFLWIVLMKIWFWLELLRNSVTREVKRLELQVALLNQTHEKS